MSAQQACYSMNAALTIIPEKLHNNLYDKYM